MSECIIWPKAKASNGYGVSWYRGKWIGAHRKTWILKKGPIPEGMFVCHKCDVKACVNIEHLFLGTPTDNVQDMFKKGRAKPFNPTKVKNGKKPCNRCGKIKPLSEFSKSHTSKYTGLPIYQPACKKCR